MLFFLTNALDAPGVTAPLAYSAGGTLPRGVLAALDGPARPCDILNDIGDPPLTCPVGVCPCCELIDNCLLTGTFGVEVDDAAAGGGGRAALDIDACRTGWLAGGGGGISPVLGIKYPLRKRRYTRPRQPECVRQEGAPFEVALQKSR